MAMIALPSEATIPPHYKELNSLMSMTAIVRHYDFPLQSRTALENKRLNDIYEAIKTAESQASQQDWNGENASPIPAIAFDFSQILLKSLSNSVPLPEIGGDPDGAVELFWAFDNERLTATVFPDGFITIVGRIAQVPISKTDRVISAEILPTLLYNYLGQMFGKPGLRFRR